ncbi:MAG: hypothetical protein WAN25_09500 [Candidatus Acidiferrum sp.]
MLGQRPHPSDREILLALDDELTSRQRIAVHAHLAACITCRARMEKIERTLAEIAAVRHNDAGEQLPPAAGPRALLKARLAESGALRSPGSRPRIGWFTMAAPRWVLACSALFIAALAIWAVRQEVRSQTPGIILAQRELGAVPDKALTPGAILPVSAADVCRADGMQETRPIPASTRRKVFQEYRMPESRGSEYEVDFLITPGLGGAEDVRNLWLEPYSSTVWNAHVKDALEDRLHELVCSGNLDLATAQHEIATDWIAAYKKYFHTEIPVSDSSGTTSNHL